MGNFYVNYTVRTDDQAAIIKALAGRNAFLTSANKGAIVVFDEAADSQDVDVVMALGVHLSRELGCPVLAVLNHDDDILWYGLFEKGRCIDEYDSSPGYFDEGGSRPPEGGNAAKLCAAFQSPNIARVEAILRKPYGDNGYTFAYERHADLVSALDLPDFPVAFGFRYVSLGGTPRGLSLNDLTRVT